LPNFCSQLPIIERLLVCSQREHKKTPTPEFCLLITGHLPIEIVFFMAFSRQLEVAAKMATLLYNTFGAPKSTA